ncbi:MAG: hypothetical protein AAI978_00905 [Candidatus Hodgkinia cicadicola]
MLFSNSLSWLFLLIFDVICFFCSLIDVSFQTERLQQGAEFVIMLTALLFACCNAIW